MRSGYIGVAWSRGKSLTADALVAAADEAMYECKRARRRQPKAA
jgi:GGDEF domain-containing protein